MLLCFVIVLLVAILMFLLFKWEWELEPAFAFSLFLSILATYGFVWFNTNIYPVQYKETKKNYELVHSPLISNDHLVVYNNRKFLFAIMDKGNMVLFEEYDHNVDFYTINSKASVDIYKKELVPNFWNAFKFHWTSESYKIYAPNKSVLRIFRQYR